MSGFIYIWFDRKHKRYYVGSHWGSENDGYICSSTWMLQAYKRRPQDFRRRILERYDDQKLSNEIEHKWLQMIKPEELKGVRYYNHHNYRFGHWSSNSDKLTIGEKISKARKGVPLTEEARQNVHKGIVDSYAAGRVSGMKGKTQSTKHADYLKTRRGKPRSEETKRKISEAKKKAWRDGTFAGRTGHLATEETKEKMSASIKNALQITRKNNGY